MIGDCILSGGGSKEHRWRQVTEIVLSCRNEKQSDARVAWIGAVIGAGFGLITLVVVMPIIRRRILRDEERAAQ